MTGHDRSYNLLQSWLVAGLVIVAIIVALQDSFVTMFRLWIEIEHFNHCLLIAPISAWLIWRKRHELARIEPSVSFAGLALTVFVAGIWLIGSVANVDVVQEFAATALIPLSVWAILGTSVARTILFPLGYLFFLVPFGGFLIAPMMDFTADMTVAAVRASGIPIYRDGLYFAIPNGSFQIIEACSGIRMLMAGLAVGALFAYLNFHSWWRRTVFMIGIVVLALIANWLRAYLVVIIAHYYGMDHVTDHIWLGYAIFAIVIVIMLWAGALFSDTAQGVEAEPGAGSSRPVAQADSFGATLISAGVILAAIVSAPIFASTVMERATQIEYQPVAQLPRGLAGWAGPRSIPDDWHPAFRGDTVVRAGRYLGAEAAIDVFIISYRSLSRQSELINETNRVYDPARWMLIGEKNGIIRSAGDKPLAYVETVIRRFAGKGRLVRHWYIVGGRPYRSRMKVKFIELVNILTNRPTPAGMIAVSTRFSDDAGKSARVLDDFMAKINR